MSNLFARIASKRFFNAVLFGGLLVLTVSGTGQAATGGAAADEPAMVRSSISRHYVSGGGENPALSSESTEDFTALSTTGSRSNSGTRAGYAKPGSGSASARSFRNDFWIYDADVQLFNDDDNDGYYHGVDLLFDADTIYSAAEIYAVVYLSLDFGPWNEYGVTENFWIFGASGDDEYVLVTELMSGYPTGDYDLLIEIFDANDNTFLASFGPDETSVLGFLPLEDFDRDEPIAITIAPVAHSHGGGGAADAWTISLLLLVLVVSAGRKIWRRRKDALVRIDSPAPCWTARTSK
jgi:hypothetical protein